MVSDLRCPTCGHVSTDREFCSDCGAAMDVAPAAPAAAPIVAAPEGPDICPVCHEARPSKQARYCDTCRYDFVEHRPFSADAATAQPASPPPPPSVTPAPAQVVTIAVPTPVAARWDLVAQVDPSLRREEDPAPSDLRERVFPLDHADHLIGRRDDHADVHPEIPIPDPGISRRHARILRATDGALTILDIGSTNGTWVNEVALEANIPTAITDADRITLGCWTRLVLKRR